MANTFGQGNRASTQFFNNMNRMFSRNNKQQSSNTASNPPQLMRTQIKVAFDQPHAPASSDVVAVNIRAGWQRSSPIIT